MSSVGRVLSPLSEATQLYNQPVTCGLCVGTSTSYCQTCSKHLCRDCKSSHKEQRVSRDHDVVEVLQNTEISQPTQSTREGKILASHVEGKQLLNDLASCHKCHKPSEAYCQTCGKYMCSDCGESHTRQKKFRKHTIFRNYEAKVSDNSEELRAKNKVSISRDVSLAKEIIGLRAIRNSVIPWRNGKANTAEFDYISRRVSQRSFIGQFYGSAQLVEVDKTKIGVANLQTKFPKPKTEFGDHILTIDKSHHVIVSLDGFHLCGKSGVIRSVHHTKDGYRPFCIRYINPEVFVSFSLEQKKIRYHCVKTLDIISTHKLITDDEKMEFRSRVCMITNGMDILVDTDTTQNKGNQNVLLRFNSNGMMKGTVGLHPEFANIGDWTTVCMAGKDQILAAQGIAQGIDPGIIHMFGLNGEHQVVTRIQGPCMPLAMGVDDESLCITYWRPDMDKAIIAKYSFIHKETTVNKKPDELASDMTNTINIIGLLFIMFIATIIYKFIP